MLEIKSANSKVNVKHFLQYDILKVKQAQIQTWSK